MWGSRLLNRHVAPKMLRRTIKRRPSSERWRRLFMPWTAPAGELFCIMLFAALNIGGCRTTIIPPSPDALCDNPALVHIADYGRHSSILLPLDDGDDRMVEYGFGEWRFFALNEDGIGDVLRALCVPTDGAIGRRFVRGPFTEAHLQPRLAFERLHSFRVRREDAIALREDLDRRYAAHIDSEIYNERHDLHFVRVDEPYTLGNNCNPVLGRWLRQLGCEQRGFALVSDWCIAAPE